MKTGWFGADRRKETGVMLFLHDSSKRASETADVTSLILQAVVPDWNDDVERLLISGSGQPI